MADLKLLMAVPRSPPTFLNRFVPNSKRTINNNSTNSHIPIPMVNL